VNTDQWRRVESLFHQAVDLDPDARARFLDAECGDDAELRAEVERLVTDDDGADPVLDGGGAVPAAAAEDPLVGKTIGNYRLTGILGAGGMGVVYAGERADGLFEQDVAVKVVRAALGGPELLRRFEEERRALAALNHPNIARMYDGGTSEDGSPYLVMERIRGVPIDRWCDEGRLSVDARLRLFAKVARAVHFAHTNLVVHRDLKPSNVLVDDSGAAKLLDFGIARLLDRDGSDASQPATQVMTPEYASPEQLAGAPVTTATDVYSLGVVLYVLLTGRRPYHFTSQSPAAWERLVAERTPTRPSTAVVREHGDPVRPDAPPPLEPDEIAERFDTTPARLRRRLSGDLDRIVMMALRPEPERRYSSAQELAEDVERHLAGLPVRAREETLAYRFARFAQRNRVVVLAISAVLAAMIGGSAAAWRGERRARREADMADVQAGIARDEARRADEQAALALAQAEHARNQSESAAAIAVFLEEQVQGQLDPGLRDEEERLATAAAMLERQAEQTRRTYPDQPRVRANVLDALGRYAMRLGLESIATELIDEALHAREAEFGPDGGEVALSLESRGLLLYYAGRFDEAEPVLRRRLTLLSTLEDARPSDVARAANDLAAVLRNLGRLDEAEELHREALALRRAGGTADLPVAESLNNLAGIALGRGRPGEAVEMLEESLAIRRKILGDAHPLAAQAVSNLASACFRAGEREKGAAYLRDAEREFRALGPIGRQGLGHVLSGLAAVALSERDVEEAEARLEEALEVRRALLPPGHPDLVTLMERRADLLDQLERRDEADALWREVVAARRELYGDLHPKVARTLRLHADLLFRLERFEDARVALAEAVDLLRAIHSPNPAELGRAEVALGRALAALRRFDEGLELARAGLARLETAADASPDELEWARSFVKELEHGR